MIRIFDSTVEDAGKEDTFALLVDHLHQEVSIADLLHALGVGTLERLL